ncbi:MAG: WD40/YVTN/BNR-like repeat-containing protein [Planctomycetota bacterium]
MSLSLRIVRWNRRAAVLSRQPNLDARENPAGDMDRFPPLPLPACKLLALIAFMCGVLAAPMASAQMATKKQAHMTPRMLDDAGLNDIFFLNSDLGWAVGDRGVVLHTEDGGRHWRIQRLSTAARLESVHFINGQRGWVVGGRVHAHTRRTSCFIARTRDGGENWRVVPEMTLPGLEQVQFHDSEHGSLRTTHYLALWISTIYCVM